MNKYKNKKERNSIDFLLSSMEVLHEPESKSSPDTNPVSPQLGLSSLQNYKECFCFLSHPMYSLIDICPLPIDQLRKLKIL